MKYLLDTNIISDSVKAVPSQVLADWMTRHGDEDLFISSLTVAEIRKGILLLAPGRKRQVLEAWFFGPEGPQSLFAGRVLPFDEEAALIWARLMSEGQASGRTRSELDTMIGAIGEANGCVIVTANERHFAGLRVVNPMKPGRPV